MAARTTNEILTDLRDHIRDHEDEFPAGADRALSEAIVLGEDRVEMPVSLASEIREALEGDSNDTEHDALVSVAQQFDIEYAQEEDAYSGTTE